MRWGTLLPITVFLVAACGSDSTEDEEDPPLDPPATPIADSSVDEGDSGSATLVFDVTPSEAGD